MILLASFALFIGGLSVAWSGVTGVMVPLDLEHNGIGLGRIQALSPRLMDLIRQDGLVLGSVVSLTGFLLFFVTWCSPSSGSFYSVLVIIFAAGTAITLFQHFFIGHQHPMFYVSAYLRLALLGGGLALMTPAFLKQRGSKP